MFSYFSSGSYFVQWSKNGLFELVEGYPKNFSVKLFQIMSSTFAGEVVKAKVEYARTDS